MKIPATLFLSVAIFTTLSGCGSPEISSTCQNGNTYWYPPNFTIKEALFIRERNCRPHITVSAFLIDRERGLFTSAKHFVGSESDGQAKIFFNGRVYDGFLVRLPPVTDIAVIKISGRFNPADFPEPYKIAGHAEVGDKVFVRGIHPHPVGLIGNKKIIPITLIYYGELGTGQEFVYDDLEAKVTDLAYKIKNEEIGGSSELLSGITNTYIKLETKEDHRFSFGGLSGGPTVNGRNELVGINSSEKEGGLELTREGIGYVPWKTFHLVPASELEKLMSLTADIK